MLETVDVPVKLLSENATLPRVMQAQDVAADLFSAVDALIPARGRAVIPTDLTLDLPEGFRGRIYGRSGLGAKYGIDVGAGVIDQGFRGNLAVLLFNHSDREYAVARGDRIAQLAIERYLHPNFFSVSAVSTTDRSEGWGSSGR